MSGICRTCLCLLCTCTRQQASDDQAPLARSRQHVQAILGHLWRDLTSVARVASGASCPASASPALPRPAPPFPSLPFPSLPFPSLPFPSLPFPSLPFPSLPCPALPCPALPCPALPCPVLSCPVLSCPVLPDTAWMHKIACLLTLSTAYIIALHKLNGCCAH